MSWQTVALSDLLVQDTDVIPVRDTDRETFLTIRLYGLGMVERRIAVGKAPKPFVGYRVRAGQFVYSRIDARNGAYGLVPDNLDGAVCSKDFPKFDHRQERVDLHYLLHIVRSSEFYRRVQDLSFGATNRQRVKEDEFLSLRVPLPPLPEQRRIAAILDHADALRAKRRESIARLDDLSRSIFMDLFGPALESGEQVTLGDALQSIDSGRSPKCHSRPAAEGEYGVLKLSAVTTGEYLPGENKALPEDQVYDPRHEVRAGDLLFTRKNTKDLVAACAYVRQTPPGMLLPDLVFRLNLRSDALLRPRFVQQVLMHPVVRGRVQRLAGGSAGSMPNVSKGKLATVQIPRPPLGLQDEFDRRIEKLDSLRPCFQGNSESIDTLFASLQSRAFRGEL